jgi:hypothetical protein
MNTKEKLESEADWLTAIDPYALSRYLRNQNADPYPHHRRFRWLAIEWGMRIRHIFGLDYECREKLAWFDAMVEWVRKESGPNPKPVHNLQYTALDRPMERIAAARGYLSLIELDHWMMACSYAAEACGEDFPESPSANIDYNHNHRPRNRRAREEIDRLETAIRERTQLEREHHRQRIWQEFADAFRDVAGNPFRPVTIQPEWRCDTVTTLVSAIATHGMYDLLPIVADLLEDAGCTESELLDHCRGPGPHVRGCWAVELLNGESPAS